VRGHHGHFALPDSHLVGNLFSIHALCGLVVNSVKTAVFEFVPLLRFALNNLFKTVDFFDLFEGLFFAGFRQTLVNGRIEKMVVRVSFLRSVAYSCLGRLQVLTS
jgi:hypothetical protein